MKMRAIMRRVGAALVAASLAAGAWAQAPEKKKITIAVGGKSLFYYLPLTVAERKGYFKDEGLEVEIPDFAGGARALQALVGGSADMVSGAYEHTINMAAKKQPIKAVVLQAKYSSIALVMSKEKAARYHGGKDLKGMKDIYGGDYHASVIYITEEFIRKNPDTVQAVVNAMVRADQWIAKATPQQIVDLMPAEYKAGNPSLYKEALLKNMIGFSETGEMSMKAAENVYKVLAKFEPSVMAAGKIDLQSTFDNSFVKKANAKYK